MRTAYRSDGPQCCACRITVDEDFYLSFEGEPLCYDCFMHQEKPGPSFDEAKLAPPTGFGLARRRVAWWLHEAGVPGLMSAGLFSLSFFALPQSLAMSAALASGGALAAWRSWLHTRTAFVSAGRSTRSRVRALT